MKIIWIERKEETAKYYFTKAKFRTWWGKEFTSTCITEKGKLFTNYCESGNYIPVSLWTPFLAFLESKMDYMQP